MEKTTPLPKSLHTITALVCFARALRHYGLRNFSTEDAMALAVRELGLESRPDEHGLVTAALRILTAEVKGEEKPEAA